MTSEQRNEIAMEVLDEVLTEATRYAKETHKKTEQLKKEIERNKKRLSAIENSPAKNKNEIIQKYEDKISKLEYKLDDLKSRDTIENAARERSLLNHYDDGRKAAHNNSINGFGAKNYGRYAYKEPRKDVHNTPGDYKDL